jgi:type VI secretion system protein ImpF
MARIPKELTVVPSLLDRLLDDDPGVSKEPAAARLQNVRELKASVARDLEAMLNTHREALLDMADGYPEVSRSLATYGLPDLLTFDLRNHQDRNRICRLLEQAVMNFELRLKQVRVTLGQPREHEHALRFRLDALLEVKPAREKAAFDVVLQLTTQQYQVEGKD